MRQCSHSQGGGYLTQTDDSALQSLCSVKKAEAGLGSALGGLAKKAGKEAASKALNIDVDSLNGTKDGVLKSLYNAAVCYGQASLDISSALGLDDGKRSALQAAMSNLKGNKTDLGSIKQVTDASKLDSKTVEEAANNLMNSGDQEKIAKANELIKKSKAERQAANIYKILAARDATKLISSSTKALASGSKNLGDKVKVVQELLDTGKSAKSITDDIGANHKVMSTALKSYEKKNNIAEVSKEDALSQTKGMTIE